MYVEDERWKHEIGDCEWIRRGVRKVINLK